MLSSKFIKATNEKNGLSKHIPAPYFRKSFNLNFVPKTASITICGLGFYEIYINGINITKGPLAPYINNPDHICYYDKYDILQYLKSGENVIGIVLGNGFFNQCCVGWQFNKASWSGPLRFALYFIAKCECETLEFEADETFKTHKSPIIFDEYRYGTHYNANLEIKNWNNIGFDDRGWKNAMKAKAPNGKAVLCGAEPIGVIDEIAPIKITRQKDFCYLYTSSSEDAKPIECTRVEDGYLYDFGVNSAGVCRLKIKGKKGQKIILRHGEALRSGFFNMNSIITIKEGFEQYINLLQSDVYILKGGAEEIYVPPFTYHGFRYVLVEGLYEEQATDSLLTYFVMSSKLQKRAKFNCSNEIVNKLFEFTRRSDLSNFYYFPTDCPQREKNGWTGDASVSVEHILINLCAEKSFREWLRNIRKSQTAEGMLPGIVPTSGWGYEWGNGPAWDAVCVNLPYYCYKYDGNLDILIENADMIFKYLKYIETKADDRGLIHIGLGDWCQPNHTNNTFSSPLEFTDSATVLDIAKKASFIFETINMNERKAFADNLAKKMRKTIRENLIDFETMTAIGNCQTSQALAIEFEIFEDSEKEQAFNILLDIIQNKNNGYIDCGVIGIRYIFHVLSKHNRADLAFKMITRLDAPSYGSLVSLGATTLWESLKQNGVQESQNHHFLGDISSWFIQYIAGLKPNPNIADLREFEISPCFIDELDFARAAFNSKFGEVSSEWERYENKIILKVTVPKEIHGVIKLTSNFEFLDKTKTKKLKSGEYEVYTCFSKN